MNGHARKTRRAAIIFILAVTSCGGAAGIDDEGRAGGGKGGARTGGKGGGGGTTATTGGSGGSNEGGSGGSRTTGGRGGASASGGALGGAGLGGSTPGAASLPSAFAGGLIGYWPMDEGDGTKAADKSGNDNHATRTKGGTALSPIDDNPMWAAGKFGKAISLDGQAAWLRVTDSESLDSTGINNAVSVSAWVFLNALNTTKAYNVFVNRHEIGTRIEQFALNMVDGLPSATVHFFTASGPQNVPLSQWVHLAMTYDGITMRVYMDGEEVSFQDIGWPIAADETPLTIGAAINEEDVIEHINGLIDEVGVWNRKLEPAEVAKLAGR